MNRTLEHITNRTRRKLKRAKSETTVAIGWASPLRFQFCVDCCPYCNDLTRPITEHLDCGWLVMAYRCRNGHDWHTGWDKSIAAVQHHGAIAEGLAEKAWPPLMAKRQ